MKAVTEQLNDSMNRAELSRDQVFELLNSMRRRYAVHYLRRENCRVDFADVTNHVAAWEYNTTPTALLSEQRKRVYISLYQTHIPALANAGIIDYNPETGEIQPTSRIRVFDDYLNVFTRPMLPWNRYYCGLTLGSILLFMGIWGHFYPVTVLSWFVAILGVLTAFGMLSATHYWYTQNTIPETPPELHSTDD
ncbi:DUF7344 domain-containing protein [Haladaptatus caseinilyticus]|uniref:DUF7344 domain-containing protein n=1 Tax=Haladaptatus caseinilyticus TaxID=2993314 RepID=UPI00224AA4CE|nr:hypothetical protein [Haladaptatus caseinilyticus]